MSGGMDVPCNTCFFGPPDSFKKECTNCINGEQYEQKDDPVKSPSHYMTWPDMESIDIMRKVLTREEFIGFCKGNFLKYRLRAGKKDNLEQDINKSEKYREWLFEMGDEE